MKHILPLLTIALACIASTSYAALTYEVAKTPYTNQNYQGTDWEYYTVKITGGSGKLYVVDVLDNVSDTTSLEKPQSVNLRGKGITQYGYYKITRDEEGKITSVSDLVVKNLAGNEVKFNTFDSPYNKGVKITRYGYELGDFEEGDEVEIYLSTGNAYSSTNNTAHSGYNPNISRYGRWTDAMANYLYGWNEGMEKMKVAELTLYDGWNPNQVPFLIRSDSEMDSFGAPLPGGLPIILVSGLFALGFWFVRRRKAIAI